MVPCLAKKLRTRLLHIRLLFQPEPFARKLPRGEVRELW